MPIILAAIMAIFISFLLKKWSLFSRHKKQKEQCDLYFEKMNLIATVAPYEDYKTEIKKVAVRNKPIRENGDFFDFILPYIQTRSSFSIEGILSTINCGDEIG